MIVRAHILPEFERCNHIFMVARVLWMQQINTAANANPIPLMLLLCTSPRCILMQTHCNVLTPTSPCPPPRPPHHEFLTSAIDTKEGKAHPPEHGGDVPLLNRQVEGHVDAAGGSNAVELVGQADVHQGSTVRGRTHTVDPQENDPFSVSNHHGCIGTCAWCYWHVAVCMFHLPVPYPCPLGLNPYPTRPHTARFQQPLITP